METFLKRIPEQPVPGKPLGRHIGHDPRSREFALEADITARVTVTHKRHGGILDQGNLGSCTCNAAAGAINTEPLYLTDYKKLLKEPDAVALYELATTLDEFDGSYPPDDTGSTGLAAAKAARSKGYIKRYEHAFTLEAALTSLQKRSGITGVNWYEGFDNPDADGLVAIEGQVRGGHEFQLCGYHVQPGTNRTLDLIEAINSWGSGWGKKGHFFFTVATWEQLLNEQGDYTVLLG